MSERERSRRKKCYFVMVEAWRIKKRTQLFSYSFGTCLKLAWKVIKGLSRRLHTKVVGVTFEGRQKVLGRLLHYHPDQVIIHLNRDPHNPYDPCAIAVVAEVINKGSAPLGYLNSQLAATLAPYMDDGGQLIVYDFDITGGEAKNFGCNISYLMA